MDRVHIWFLLALHKLRQEAYFSLGTAFQHQDLIICVQEHTWGIQHDFWDSGFSFLVQNQVSWVQVLVFFNTGTNCQVQDQFICVQYQDFLSCLVARHLGLGPQFGDLVSGSLGLRSSFLGLWSGVFSLEQLFRF